MPEVLALARRVEPDDRAELLPVRGHGHLRRLAVLEPDDVERLMAGETERLTALAREVLQRDDPHHQQVGAVDALVALGDGRLHAEQVRPLRGPVAGRAGAVLLPREDDRRRALGEVALGGGEDRHLLAGREVHRPRPLGAGHEQVAEADVGERAAHHHLVIAAPRPVGVEVDRLDAVPDEVLPGRRVALDRAGGGDVVGRDGVSDRDEAARAGDVRDRRGRRSPCRRSTAAGARRWSRPPTRTARRSAPAARARPPRPRRRSRRSRGTSRARSPPPSSPAPRPARARCPRGTRGCRRGPSASGSVITSTSIRPASA